MTKMTVQESIIEAVEYFDRALLDATNRSIRKRIKKKTGTLLEANLLNKELVAAHINGLIEFVGTSGSEGARSYKPVGAQEPWKVRA